MAEQVEIPSSLIHELVALIGHQVEEVELILIHPEQGWVSIELRIPIGPPPAPLDPWGEEMP